MLSCTALFLEFFFHYIDWCEAGDLTSNDNRSVNREKKLRSEDYCIPSLISAKRVNIVHSVPLSCTNTPFMHCDYYRLRCCCCFVFFHLINDARIKSKVYFVLFLLFITYSTGNNVASSCIISLSFFVSLFLVFLLFHRFCLYRMKTNPLLLCIFERTNEWSRKNNRIDFVRLFVLVIVR